MYLVDGDAEPVSPGCIPQVVDAADRIGLAFDGRGGHAVINALQGDLAVELTPRTASGRGTRTVARIHEGVPANMSGGSIFIILPCTFDGWNLLWSENGQ